VLVAALGLLLTGISGSSAGAQQPPAGTTAATPASRPERGAVFNGLERDTSALCRGGFKVRRTTLCTHGPDEAPPGTDIRQTSAPATDSSAGAVPSQAAEAAARCDGDGTSGKRTQILYVRASDRPDRFAAYVASFRLWAAQASVAYEDSAAEQGTFQTRSIRFVHDQSCTITVTSVVLPPSGDDDFSNTIAGLQSLGFNRTDRKYVSFVDATVYCGIGNIWVDDRPGSANLNTGGPSYSRVDTGCWGGRVAAHEHMHNIGGVQASAPHATPNLHCTDEYDRMCYQDAPETQLQLVCADSSRDTLFDCNHDDYFSVNPPAGSYLATHLNPADSPYLVPGTLSPACNGLTPTIASAGTINGTPGDDVILGSPGPNVINGAAGNDTICGLDGDDSLSGGPGDDVLNGGMGNDNLDVVDSVTANDRIDGAGGRDVCTGDPGDARVNCSTQGDYDGNGTTDIAVVRPSSGTWYVRNGTTVNWGTSGDVPVPGDYDGNGTTDIAVFRPSSGTWYVPN
jgi:hypothetical protein